MKKNSSREGDSEDEEKPEEPQPSNGPTTLLDTKHRYFIGKDYSNSYEKDFEFLEKFGEGQFSPLSSLSLSHFFSLLQTTSIESSFLECPGTTKPWWSSVKLLGTSLDISFNAGTFTKCVEHFSLPLSLLRTVDSPSARNSSTTTPTRFSCRKPSPMKTIFE